MNGRKIWRSLEEYQQSDSFGDMLKAEFPSIFELWQVDRRQLLNVMGASLALAGLSGCKPARSNDVVPFVNRPEGFLEGRVDHYATAVLMDGYAQPVLATTSAGRPIKLDGNPEHPASRGGSSIFMQAAILDLYDPDRSQAPLLNGHSASWEDFDAQLARWRAAWRSNGGAGLRLLVGPTTSPTLIKQLTQLQSSLPNCRVHVFDPLDANAAAGSPELSLRWDSARCIVSLDHDLLGPGPRQVTHARAWTARRGEAVGDDRLTLFAAETTPTLTGAKADRRVGIAPSRLPLLGAALAARLGVGALDAASHLTPAETAWIAAAATALGRNGGSSIVTAGRHSQPELQTLAFELNQKLGNHGRTIEYVQSATFAPGDGGSFLDLARDIAASRVAALLVLGANPVYTAPADLDFASLYRRVPLRIHAGLHADETAMQSDWHLPLPHFLEDWSDARAPDGLATIIQPVVQPLYDSRSLHSIVAGLTSDSAGPPRDIISMTWADRLGDEAGWQSALKLGFVPGTQSALAAAVPSAQVGSAPAPRPAADNAVEIVFAADPTIRDGSHANNAWLQELPKPLTKTTWENVVAISPELAKQLRLANGDRVEVESGGRRLTGPAWIVPGQPDAVVTLYLGYGRSHAGRVGTDIGYNAYALRTSAAPWTAPGAIHASGGRAEVATTQLHHGMEGQDLVRTVSAADQVAVRKDERDQDSFYPRWPEGEAAWGMVIDLDRCIGCNACVVACQSENNVPVVGKDQVAKGREMHWLRVDRYYAGEPEDPETYFQPVPCMHCEQAPCEMGCPVHATVHSPDGLNLMVYNRCIGTRTCSSYCPYKVRRFNWFDYTSDAPESIAAQRNPDVTVRGRGVMEKCTYCIQRIEAAKVQADIENRPVRDDEAMTACQQACPAEAISFGNLADRGSTVARKRAEPRNYALLAEQGTRPRTTYLARVEKEGGNGE